MPFGDSVRRKRTYSLTEKDFYRTPTYAIKKLLEVETFDGTICEPASGDGAISKVLENAGHDVLSSDIRTGDHIYGQGGRDLFDLSGLVANNAITNPPYRHAEAVARHLLSITDRKVALFLRLAFLESQGRYALFEETPLSVVHVFCKRLTLYAGDVAPDNGGMAAYAWFVWEHGCEFQPALNWIPA
jgi:hypothetical protein